jgi:hypothetical protein
MTFPMMKLCVCVHALQILTTDDNLLTFSNYKVLLYNFLWQFAANMKPCSGTSVVELEFCIVNNTNMAFLWTVNRYYALCSYVEPKSHKLLTNKSI